MKKSINEPEIKEAYFGMGCFWKPQYIFSKIKGLNVMVGYMGGNSPANYLEVCTGNTGHAEVVKIVYDRKEVSYASLLKLFWDNHNPTTLNRQGLDIGHQYRSVIFYTDKNQKELAEISKKDIENMLGKKVVTEIKKAKKFYQAEESHQNYYEKQGVLDENY